VSGGYEDDRRGPDDQGTELAPGPPLPHQVPERRARERSLGYLEEAMGEAGDPMLAEETADLLKLAGVGWQVERAGSRASPPASTSNLRHGGSSETKR
jgi:hypothetical protein